MQNNKLHKILSEVRNSIKNEYELEYFQFHQYRYLYILDKIVKLQLPPSARILDVGCYPPHLSTALKKLEYFVYGISSYHEKVKMPNVAVLNIEKDTLRFKKNFFNVILFSEIMEHLVANPLIYLLKFKKILSPKGKLLITTPNSAGLHKIVPILMGRSTYFPLSDLLKTKWENDSIYDRHNREYTLEELRYLLEKAGFFINSCKYFNAYRSYQHEEVLAKPYRKLVRYFTFWITNVFKRLQDSLYIEATIEKKNKS